jgi:imidazoleglycerol-phosphate dehydratase
MRNAVIERKTKETDITAELNVDGSGRCDISTGIGFFDHMLTALAVHAGFDFTLRAKGDLEVDGHHTVEDTGIVLGQALKKALGSNAGIARYGSFLLPMDESLAECALDICSRPFLVFTGMCPEVMIGAYDSALTEEFLRAFAMNAGITLHVNIRYGKNAHHMTEAAFKALGHALRAACVLTGGPALSTKGSL